MPLTTFELLEQIENTQGTNAKRAILQANANNFLLRQVFQVVLDPYLNYGVVKVTRPQPDPRPHCNEGVMIAMTSLLLGELANRELTGGAAKKAVEDVFFCANALEQKWLGRIINRNLRCGVSTTIVNEVWPGTIRGFSTALCNTLKHAAKTLKPKDLAKLARVPANGEIVEISARSFLVSFGGETIRFNFSEDAIEHWPVRANPKLDGLRCVAVKKKGSVTLYTRNGNEIDTLPHIVADLKARPYDDIVLDGEAMSDGDQAWNDSMSVIGSTKNKKNTSRMFYNVFDSMPLADWEAQKSAERYEDRDNRVSEIVTSSGSARSWVRHVATQVCRNFRELLEFYIECLDAGYEGIVIKDPRAVYVFDRSDAMLKFKPEATYEGAVIGWFKGSRGGKRADEFGGFWVLLPNGVATRVGSGFKLPEKEEHDSVIQHSADGIGAYLGLIMEAKAQPPLTRTGKMRFPRHKRWRAMEDVDPSVLVAFQAWVDAGAVPPQVDRSASSKD